MLQCDLWGNITHYEALIDNTIETYDQKFLGEDLVYYEDSNGNIWDVKKWGECPLPILKLKVTDKIDEYDDYFVIDYENPNIKDDSEWAITTPVIYDNENIIFFGQVPYILINDFSYDNSFTICSSATISSVICGIDNTISESDLNTFIESISSRYSTVPINQDFYGEIRLNNLEDEE